jgi:2-oxoglutarate dehydrogenase E2 component (dihydrolipoamide succinyltransferase)
VNDAEPRTYRLLVPDLGLPGLPITLSVWLCRRGASLAAGQPAVELACGPATVDLPSPAGGVLVEKLAAEGDEVVPGQPLAVIRDT